MKQCAGGMTLLANIISFRRALEHFKTTTGVCEAHLLQAYKPLVIVVIPLEPYGMYGGGLLLKVGTRRQVRLKSSLR